MAACERERPRTWADVLRQPRRRLDILALAACLLIAAISLGANPLRQTTVGPFDLLLAQPGWGSQITGSAVRNIERSDVLDNYLPRWMAARQAIRRGELPLWNPAAGGGEPGLFNVASGELTPAFTIFALSPTPARGLYLSTLFNLVFAGFGLYLFLRQRLAFVPSLFGGLAFMLCGFNAAWLYWPHVSSLMWMGWLLWALDRTIAGRSQGVGALAVSSALLILGGFPYVSLLGMAASVLFLACVAVADPRTCNRHVMARLLVGYAAGVGLAAPGLLGLGEWLAEFDLGYRLGSSSLILADARYLLPWPARELPGVENTMYIGVVALALSLLGLVAGAFGAFRRRVGPLWLFAAFLAIAASLLVFGVIPPGWVSWVPGLRNNPWSRTISMLDLALVILAAFAFDRILQWRRARALMLVMAVVVLVANTYDQVGLFRHFNGPMKAATFYPHTPLIDDIIARQQPFQSTIADDNYLVAGTLGAYGIPEWFGHGFKSSGLQALLGTVADDPFVTPTASRLDAGTLHPDRPQMVALGVRFLLGGSSLVYDLVAQDEVVAALKIATAPMPPMPGAALAQEFQVDRLRTVSAVSVMTANYNRPDQHGDLLVALGPAGAGPKLARWTVHANSIRDNQLLTLDLPVPVNLAPGRYRIDFSYVGALPDDQLTLWSVPGQFSQCVALANNAPTGGCLQFYLNVPRTDLGPYREIAREGSLHLLENPQAPRGPYVLPDLQASPRADSSDDVHLSLHNNHRFDVAYDGANAGWLVVPMTMRHGWVIRRGGELVRPQRYLATLPAVEVSKGDTVSYAYQPHSLSYGVPTAAVTMLCLVGGAWSRRRRRAASR